MVTATVLPRGGVPPAQIPQQFPHYSVASALGTAVWVAGISPVLHNIDRTGMMVLSEIRWPWPV
jgi:hypothetical protein